MRKPTKEEKRAILEKMKKSWDKIKPGGEEELKEMLIKSKKVVFENYTPETPGYSGKIAVVIFPLNASLTTVYGFKGGRAIILN